MRMAQEGNAMTTVVLHNGDNLTGAVQLDQVVIQTEWGRAEINGNHVASILFTPGLKWSSETGLNGMRWKLVADEPARTAPNAAAGQRGGQPGAPGTPGIPGVPAANQPRPGTQPVYQARPVLPLGRTSSFCSPTIRPGPTMASWAIRRSRLRILIDSPARASSSLAAIRLRASAARA